MTMRLFVVLIMVSWSVRDSRGCPVACGCDEFPRDPLRNDNVLYAAVTCATAPNSTDDLPGNTNRLILRDLPRPSTTDIDVFLQNLSLEGEQRFPYLFHLALTRCAIPDLSNVSFGGLERLRSLDLSGNGVKQLPLDPEAAFNLTGLKALDLSNNEIRTIESGPFRTLTSLEVLNLSANVIDTLSQNTFAGLSRLQCLDVSSNKLIALHSEAFSPLATLQYLNLSKNLLQVLDEACLSSLQRLQQLDVSWNRLAKVAPGSLQLPSLSRLLLAGNPALGGSREPALLVGPGKRLQTVDASRTGLKQVPAALTHSVRTLRLAGNSIRSVSCGHLDSYPLLQLLDFTANDLEEIEDDALGRLELLSILYLTDNKLRAIPRDLPERLRVLHLEHNQIEQVLAGDLGGMPLLEVLLLSDNKVRVVREGAFSRLGSLATLDLSRNPISVLPAGTLSGPWQLQVLRLSNLNGVAISPAKDTAFPLSAPEHLVTLDLSNSPGLGRQFLGDTAALAASRELQELDVSGAGLEYVRSDLLHFLPQLRILRLADNALNCTELQWLAAWLRRQDQPESRRIACSSPAELAGSLLVDLQEIESETTAATTTTETATTEMRNGGWSGSRNNGVSAFRGANSSKFPNGMSGAVRDDDPSNKQNLTYISTPPPAPRQNTLVTNNATKMEGAEKEGDEEDEEEEEDKKPVDFGDAIIISSTTSPPPPPTATTTATSSRSQNVNEPEDNFFPNKPRRGTVRAEITQNLFIAWKEERPLNNGTPAAQYSDNTNGSFAREDGEKSNATETMARQENGTGTTGKMSMYTEPKRDAREVVHPGILVLFVGVLGAAAALAMLASKCNRRRRQNSYQQQDIEVSSLPSVTELW